MAVDGSDNQSAAFDNVRRDDIEAIGLQHRRVSTAALRAGMADAGLAAHDVRAQT